jgi:hypothetical protein
MRDHDFLPPLAETWPAVSIFFPVAGDHSADARDTTRFHRVLDHATARLEASVGRDVSQSILQPARGLFDQPGSGLGDRRRGGFALFASAGQFHAVPLPFTPPELTVVGRWFHIRPLLPLLVGDGRFWMLAIAAGQVRLFAGDRDGARPVDVPDMPASVADVSAETDATEGLQFNPVARPHSNRAPGVVKSHGLESPEELRKAEFIEYLHRIDRAVTGLLSTSAAPLVIAAEPEALGHYRALCSYRHLHDAAVEINPFALDLAELHRRAYALVRPRFEAPVGELKERIAARLGTAEPTVTLKLEEILSAAAYSRVEGLLLADDAMLWGNFDPATGQLEAHGTPTGPDEDLFNLAAVQTLAHGGHVYMLPHAEMPHGASAAAALRY